MRILGLEVSIRKSIATGAVPVRSSLWNMVREPFAGAWQKGFSVDPIGGLTSFGAVFACISRIANDIAKLEIQLKIEGQDGICRSAPESSPYLGVLRRPNSYQNRIQFLTYWIVSKLLFGNAYAVKVRNERGIVYALYLLDPRRVTPMVTSEGDVFYSVGGEDLARLPTGQVLPAREIIHDRGITLWHPLIGVSPIYACAISATQGNRIQSNSGQFFENMSRPSGMLTAPGSIGDETASRLKSEWEKNYSGLNLGRLAIMGDGLKYEPITIPANDAQLIQQLNWTVEDVARCYAVPLYKINAGAVPTAGNVEALESQYYSGCLQVLIESLELCMTEGLEIGSGATAGYGVELDLEGLLRMDSATQIDMLSKAVGGAIMAPNEARAKCNLPPVVGGGSVFLQQQNYSTEALAKRDAKDDPFNTAKPSENNSLAATVPAQNDQAREIVVAVEKAFNDTQSLISNYIDQIKVDAIQRRVSDEAAVSKMMESLLISIPNALAKSMPIKTEDIDDLEDVKELASKLVARFNELEYIGV